MALKAVQRFSRDTRPYPPILGHQALELLGQLDAAQPALWGTAVNAASRGYHWTKVQPAERVLNQQTNKDGRFFDGFSLVFHMNIQ